MFLEKFVDENHAQWSDFYDIVENINAPDP